jgi:tripartite-type tricarboxylate transporter receptor subunit TctC
MHHRFRPLRRTALLFTASVFVSSLSAPALAANWPTGPVTIVVPFSPGGTTDVVARLLGARLSEIWKQTVVIENKLGAGGNIGTAIVAKANPDGQTLLMASGSILTVNPHLYKDLPFNVEKDFELVTNVAEGPMVVVAAKKHPFKSLQDLIDHAKKHPKTLNMGSAGLGSQVHMAGENFAHAAQIEVTHVPYRGEAAAYTDLMAGQIDFIVGNIGAVTPLAQSGRINALAVTSKTRAKMLPELPTVAEAGVPGFENYGWFAFVAPKGTPKDVVDKIQRDTAKVLAMPDMRERLEAQGMTAVGNTPAEFKKAMDAESANWAKVIKERNIKIN